MQVSRYALEPYWHSTFVWALLPVVEIPFCADVDGHAISSSGTGHAVVGCKPISSAAQGAGHPVAELLRLSCVRSVTSSCAYNTVMLQPVYLQGFKALKTLIAGNLLTELDDEGQNPYLAAIEYPIGNR